MLLFILLILAMVFCLIAGIIYLACGTAFWFVYADVMVFAGLIALIVWIFKRRR